VTPDSSPVGHHRSSRPRREHPILPRCRFAYCSSHSQYDTAHTAWKAAFLVISPLTLRVQIRSSVSEAGAFLIHRESRDQSRPILYIFASRARISLSLQSKHLFCSTLPFQAPVSPHPTNPQGRSFLMAAYAMCPRESPQTLTLVDSPAIESRIGERQPAKKTVCKSITMIPFSPHSLTPRHRTLTAPSPLRLARHPRIIIHNQLNPYLILTISL
jgi:hypothetical protein